MQSVSFFSSAYLNQPGFSSGSFRFPSPPSTTRTPPFFRCQYTKNKFQSSHTLQGNMPKTRPNAPEAPPSSSSHRRAGRRRSDKQVVFSHEEVVPDKNSSQPATRAVRHPTSKIKRSPTPVLTSITELTNAHFHQLAGVWRERKLPSFDADKRSIAASRKEQKDPFDF